MADELNSLADKLQSEMEAAPTDLPAGLRGAVGMAMFRADLAGAPIRSLPMPRCGTGSRKAGERWEDNPMVLVLTFRPIRGNIDRLGDG